MFEILWLIKVVFGFKTVASGLVSIKHSPHTSSCGLASLFPRVCLCACALGNRERFYLVKLLICMFACTLPAATGIAWPCLNVLTLLVLTGNDKRHCQEVKGNYSSFYSFTNKAPGFLRWIWGRFLMRSNQISSNLIFQAEEQIQTCNSKVQLHFICPVPSGKHE